MTPTLLFGQLHHALTTAKRVLLVAHKKPDGDTLGSSSAVLNWLIREEKEVTAFCADLPPATYHYLDNLHRYTNDPSVFDASYDVVVVFDSGDLEYCGIASHVPRLTSGYLLVNVDHHISNKRFGRLNIVPTDASSTAEVIHDFFAANRIWIDDRMATSLLTGLVTDTSFFSNPATTATSMSAAGNLLAAGARHTDIIRSILHNKDIDGLKLWGLMLSRLHRNRAGNLASTYLLVSDGIRDAAMTDGMSNFLSAVVGDTETILVLTELPTGEVKGSFRSISRDVMKICKILGGGGHKKAAGFTIPGRIHVTKNGPTIVAPATV